ncbi:hypothetical protein HPG69_007094, partial [Diceros bicornis minor]
RLQLWQYKPSFIGSLLSTGRGNIFTINCSSFDQHGVDPAAFQAVFDRKAFHSVINYSSPTHVNISFTLSAIPEVMRVNPVISWNPEECVSINKLTVSAENLWLPHIVIVESSLITYVSSEGRIKYNGPVWVTSFCKLDIFYFPFDQQNCTFTFSSFLYTGEQDMFWQLFKIRGKIFKCGKRAPGHGQEVWEITDMSGNIIEIQGEWELLASTKPPQRCRWAATYVTRSCSVCLLCPVSVPGGGDEEQHLVRLWVQFSHTVDAVLFRLYLLLVVPPSSRSSSSGTPRHLIRLSLQIAVWSFSWS